MLRAVQALSILAKSSQVSDRPRIGTAPGTGMSLLIAGRQKLGGSLFPASFIHGQYEGLTLDGRKNSGDMAEP